MIEWPSGPHARAGQAHIAATSHATSIRLMSGLHGRPSSGADILILSLDPAIGAKAESMFPSDLIVRAATLLAQSGKAGLKIATAESCTGGLVAGLLTEIPGSSAVVERGFVVYSNEAKEEMLAVPAATIGTHGAVSEATARAMAEGALEASKA